MRTLHDQIADKCIHFNGISNKKCKAGFSYDEVDAKLKLPYRSGLPCIKPHDGDLKRLDGKAQCHCPKLQFYTEQEVQSQLDDYKAHMEKMELALKVIAPIRKEQKGKNWLGVIKCPVCEGKLHVSHAACNGHVHARCETQDCVAWME